MLIVSFNGQKLKKKKKKKKKTCPPTGELTKKNYGIFMQWNTAQK